MPPCIHWCDLSDGCLNSEQRVQWTGPLPSLSARARLPEMMDRLHFAAVERSAAKLIRCEVRPNGVACRLFGRALALRFSEPDTVASERRVVRRWRITGGSLARPNRPLGHITFGWEAGPDGEAGAEQTLWARVDGYPSRFVRGAGARPPLWPPRPVSSVYAWYHAVVTCRYLRRMAAWMMDDAETAGGEGSHAG